jgi:alginate O-acetyltransferase complex protein AlgJ
MLFVPELRAVTIGPFWGAVTIGPFWGTHARQASRCADPRYADPLPAIVDFHQQLAGAGIQLLLVPVPPKIALYPEAVSDTVVSSGDSRRFPRLDRFHERFYAILREHGVSLVDLWPVLVESRREHGKHSPLYCKTDTHWTSRASMIAAHAVRDHIKDRRWLDAIPKRQYVRRTKTIEMTGDLARMLDPAHPQTETLPVAAVGVLGQKSLEPISPWRDSPVLLIGDSHTLVFHDVTLHATGAGLPDHLAFCLGFPVDLVGVRGSGATATRIALVRRRDNLRGKKLVVWCVSMREFTEDFTGWRKVPVIR